MLIEPAQPSISSTGIFTALAAANGKVAPTPTQVVVPPQVLIQVMHGEANGQAITGDNTSQLAVGATIRNRFLLSGFGGVTTYQAAITPAQFHGIATGVLNGPSPDLANATAIYSGTWTDNVASAGCFFSPDATEWAAIQAALQSGTTTLPNIDHDPGCWLGNAQYLRKTSVGMNVNGSGAPAFIFVRQRPIPSNPAVIQIP